MAGTLYLQVPILLTLGALIWFQSMQVELPRLSDFWQSGASNLSHFLVYQLNYTFSIVAWIVVGLRRNAILGLLTHSQYQRS